MSEEDGNYQTERNIASNRPNTCATQPINQQTAQFTLHSMEFYSH